MRKWGFPGWFLHKAVMKQIAKFDYSEGFSDE